MSAARTGLSPAAAVGLSLATLFVGLVAAIVVLGAFLAQAAPRDPGLAAATLADLHDDLNRCAAGSPPGRHAILGLDLAAGEPVRVSVFDGDLDPHVAACVVDLVGSAPWPAVTTSAHARIEVR